LGKNGNSIKDLAMKDSINCFLIDDDEDDHEIFRMALNEIDKSIILHYAYNGLEAIRKIKENESLTPNFIFIDMNMPLMNGRQCLQALQQNERLKNIPVFIYSTSSDPKMIADIKGMGATDFIIKPSSFKSLIQILSQVLSVNK